MMAVAGPFNSHHTMWGPMEEEEEEDRGIATFVKDVAPYDSPRKVKFNIMRKVVRYPSEQSLLDGDEQLDKSDDESADEVSGGDVGDKAKEEEAEVNNKEVDSGVTSSESQDSTPTPAAKENTENNDAGNNTRGSRWFSQRPQIVRYQRRFPLPTPPPETEVNNGEGGEEEDNEGSESEEEEEKSGSGSENENEEDDEEGYDSVIEEDVSEQEDDPIKKIAEESFVSRKQKLQEVAKIQEVTSEQDKLLKEVAQIKEQLQQEVDKVEQASKAATAAAANAEGKTKALSARVTDLRSLLATLCGAC